MGIILGALGGMGEQMAGIGSKLMASELKKDEMAVESGMALQRAKALEEFKNTLATNTADSQRTAQVGRIDAAAGKIADTAVAGMRGIVEGGIVDKEAWTPEQQATVDQSLARDRDAIVSDPMTKFKAGVATGDVKLHDAATVELGERRLNSADKAAALKDKAAERRDETQRYIAELRDETAQKRIEALLKKTGSDKNGTREALSFIDGVRKDLASEAQNLKALYAADTKDLSTTKREAVKAEYAPKFAAIEAKRAQIENDFNALREQVGLPKTVGSTPAAPKPAASEARPKASPYPEGTRLTGPGGKRYIVRNGQPVPE